MMYFLRRELSTDDLTIFGQNISVFCPNMVNFFHNEYMFYTCGRTGVTSGCAIFSMSFNIKDVSIPSNMCCLFCLGNDPLLIPFIFSGLPVDEGGKRVKDWEDNSIS